MLNLRVTQTALYVRRGIALSPVYLSTRLIQSIRGTKRELYLMDWISFSHCSLHET